MNELLSQAREEWEAFTGLATEIYLNPEGLEETPLEHITELHPPLAVIGGMIAYALIRNEGFTAQDITQSNEKARQERRR